MIAKFRCDSIKKDGYGEEVELSAVMDGSEENSDFNKATPSANMKMYIDNEKAFGFFKPKKEYYLNFSEAD
jgi:hypothetical protein